MMYGSSPPSLSSLSWTVTDFGDTLHSTGVGGGEQAAMTATVASDAASAATLL